MGEPFLGELRLFSFNFAPKNWAQCNGQFLQINGAQALFSLLGTTYGGNGQTTFALPDLRSRTPLHFEGSVFPLGQRAGQEFHTVTQQEMPAHTHFVNATSAVGDANSPSGALLAKAPANFYGPPTGLVAMRAGTVTNAGGSQPHENRQPFLVLNWCIALFGIFPSRD